MAPKNGILTSGGWGTISASRKLHAASAKSHSKILRVLFVGTFSLPLAIPTCSSTWLRLRGSSEASKCEELRVFKWEGCKRDEMRRRGKDRASDIDVERSRELLNMRGSSMLPAQARVTGPSKACVSFASPVGRCFHSSLLWPRR